jgi:hypothetical protein
MLPVFMRNSARKSTSKADWQKPESDSTERDLIQLLTQTLTVEPGWAILQPELDYLNSFSVIYRYPGHSASKVEAKDAVGACRKVRRLIRTTFDLSV